MALPLLPVRIDARGGFPPRRAGRLDSPSARVRALRGALHDLRAGRGPDARGEQARRPARAVRPRQARPRNAPRDEQAPGRDQRPPRARLAGRKENSNSLGEVMPDTRSPDTPTTFATKGVRVERRYTEPGVHPFDAIDWELRDAEVGKFKQEQVEFPKTWSQNATNIVAQKYFRGQV